MPESPDKVFDALVIGGGPAGASAAFRLASAGRSVLVCERERFPRFHVGESLLPVNVPLFREMGVEDELRAAGCVAKHGASIVDATGEFGTRVSFSEAVTPIATSTFQVERARFDQILLNAAERAGAETRDGCQVVDATRQDDAWEVRTRSDGETRCHRARWLIDASGRDTFLASRQREKEMLADHRRLSLFAHFENVWRGDGETHGDTVLVRMADGWFWLIPIDEKRTSVGVVLEAEAFRAASLDPATAFAEAISRAPVVKERLKDATRVTEVFTASDFSYRVRRRSDAFMAAAGDAAGFLDPTFSTGVWLAMNGGERAGRLVDRCLQRPALTDWYRYRFEAAERRLYRHFTRLIEYFYDPGFTDIFLQPAEYLGLRRALGTYVSGALPRRLLPRLRLEAVLLLARWQRRVGFVPELEMPTTLATPPGEMRAAASRGPQAA